MDNNTELTIDLFLAFLIFLAYLVFHYSTDPINVLAAGVSIAALVAGKIVIDGMLRIPD